MPALSTPVQAPAPAAIPSGLFCGPREYWGWAYSTGTGIGNSYTYLMRFAFYSNMTCKVVFAIQHTYALNCALTDSWQYGGTFADQGSQLVFTLQGQHVTNDSCNPSQNGQGPIGGSLTCGYSFDSAHNILTIQLPFGFGPGNWQIFQLHKSSF